MNAIVLALLLLAADQAPPTSCQITPIYDQTTGTWVNYLSNCGPPSEHSRADNGSPS